ncbi:unnamed protein product [Darwinula stevensoni]|uniref:DNA 3'-5' helicase n=1 Tax=Darwinula stevensoni TaxID=69355 RepID=A0A7R8X2F6_9CRUS|nr:unnamed protein product [Darwinula stevensoni]CAG0883311.1 unnamed protein product [Darwinula stevensoni]
MRNIGVPEPPNLSPNSQAFDQPTRPSQIDYSQIVRAPLSRSSQGLSLSNHGSTQLSFGSGDFSDPDGVENMAKRILLEDPELAELLRSPSTESREGKSKHPFVPASRLSSRPFGMGMQKDSLGRVSNMQARASTSEAITPLLHSEQDASSQLRIGGESSPSPSYSPLPFTQVEETPAQEPPSRDEPSGNRTLSPAVNFGRLDSTLAPTKGSQFGPGHNAQVQSDLLRTTPADPYHRIFPFPYFNRIQSTVFDDTFLSDDSIVVSAPTGGGKTVIFELAIIRLLMNSGRDKTRPKMIYMAPMKALCKERMDDWSERFTSLGVKVKEATGDSDEGEYMLLQEVDLLLTTPEKFDSITRHWRDNQRLVQLVHLFMIDEVHLLSSEDRGPTLEAVVSRMKTIQKTKDSALSPVRFIAVSATIPNIEDISQWLSSVDRPAKHFVMGDEVRPVQLRKVVLGYVYHRSSTEFKFDYSLSYKLHNVISMYSEGKPTLVFCSTRKSTQQTANVLGNEMHFPMPMNQKQMLINAANSIRDSKLRDLLMKGIGFHHAGLAVSDRHTLEDLFTSANLPVLVATSTLAMGVNLPAHLVVIKGTSQYVSGSCTEYPDSQVLQMMGRAGRPQFDVSATAVVMTKSSLKEKYEHLVRGDQVIESSLHRHLREHLNAEIVLGTITDLAVAVQWIQSTFLYVRILANPRFYSIPANTDKKALVNRLQDMCMKEINALEGAGLVLLDEVTSELRPTDTGRLMARYYINFDTMLSFTQMTGDEDLSQLLAVVCGSSEVQEIPLRVSEKRTLNTLNKDKHQPTVRFPLQGKVASPQAKSQILVQAVFGCLPIQDVSLNQDTIRVMRNGQRIARCLCEYLWKEGRYKILLNAVTLAKCFRARLWEDSPHVARQLDRVGPTLAASLADASYDSFLKIEEAEPRDLEMIVNRGPPFGNHLREAAAYMPKYELHVNQEEPYGTELARVVVLLHLVNWVGLETHHTLPLSHSTILLVGDEDNNILLSHRTTDWTLIKGGGSLTRRLQVKRSSQGDELMFHVISESTVGLDINAAWTPVYVKGTEDRNQKTLQSHVDSIPSGNANWLQEVLFGTRSNGESLRCTSGAPHAIEISPIVKRNVFFMLKPGSSISFNFSNSEKKCFLHAEARLLNVDFLNVTLDLHQAFYFLFSILKLAISSTQFKECQNKLSPHEVTLHLKQRDTREREHSASPLCHQPISRHMVKFPPITNDAAKKIPTNDGRSTEIRGCSHCPKSWTMVPGGRNPKDPFLVHNILHQLSNPPKMKEPTGSPWCNYEGIHFFYFHLIHPLSIDLSHDITSAQNTPATVGGGNEKWKIKSSATQKLTLNVQIVLSSENVKNVKVPSFIPLMDTQTDMTDKLLTHQGFQFTHENVSHLITQDGKFWLWNSLILGPCNEERRSCLMKCFASTEMSWAGEDSMARNMFFKSNLYQRRKKETSIPEMWYIQHKCCSGFVGNMEQCSNEICTKKDSQLLPNKSLLFNYFHKICTTYMKNSKILNFHLNSLCFDDYSKENIDTGYRIQKEAHSESGVLKAASCCVLKDNEHDSHTVTILLCQWPARVIFDIAFSPFVFDESDKYIGSGKGTFTNSSQKGDKKLYYLFKHASHLSKRSSLIIKLHYLKTFQATLKSVPKMRCKEVLCNLPITDVLAILSQVFNWFLFLLTKREKQGEETPGLLFLDEGGMDL